MNFAKHPHQMYPMHIVTLIPKRFVNVAQCLVNNRIDTLLSIIKISMNNCIMYTWFSHQSNVCTVNGTNYMDRPQVN